MSIPILTASTLMLPGEGHPDDKSGLWRRLHYSPEPARGTAWHYTDANGLLGILNSDQLWATASLALNDRSEVEYGEAIIKELWKAADKRGIPQPCIDFAEHVLDFDFRDFASEGLFVVSASLDGDLLSQWRNYAGEDGFAVGLKMGASLAAVTTNSSTTATIGPKTEKNSAGFTTVFDPKSPPSNLFVVPGWSRVTYTLAKQYKQATAVLQDTVQSIPGRENWEDQLDQWPAFAIAARSFLLTAAALMKHPAFVDEREVRFLCSKAYVGDVEQYRTRKGKSIPYVAIASSAGPHEWAAIDSAKLPIGSVRYGPGSDTRGLSVASSLLERRGYPKVKISRSNIPVAN